MVPRRDIKGWHELAHIWDQTQPQVSFTQPLWGAGGVNEQPQHNSSKAHMHARAPHEWDIWIRFVSFLLFSCLSSSSLIETDSTSKSLGGVGFVRPLHALFRCKRLSRVYGASSFHFAVIVCDHNTVGRHHASCGAFGCTLSALLWRQRIVCFYDELTSVISHWFVATLRVIGFLCVLILSTFVSGIYLCCSRRAAHFILFSKCKHGPNFWSPSLCYAWSHLCDLNT